MILMLSKKRWATKPLGDIATIDRDAVPPEQIRSGTKYVGLENITSEGQFAGVSEVSNGELASTKFRFTGKHILYGKLRPYLSKIARPHFDGVCSTDILPILPGKSVNRGYLTYYLRLPEMVNLAANRSIGANLPRLSPKQLAEFEIPLPPLPEQKRIADILDQADGIRRKRQDMTAATNRLLPSAFQELFGNPVANDRQWPRMIFADLLEKIESGWSPQCLDRPITQGEWGVLKLGAVTYGEYRPINNKALPPSECSRPELEVRSGDLLISRKNTYELVGACAFVFDTPEHLMLPDLIFRPRLKMPKRLLPEYLWGLLTHPQKKKKVQALASGSSGSMPNISKERLEGIAIEVPPMELQARYAELVWKHHAFSMKLASVTNDMSDLFNALLQRAFQGEL